MLSEPQIVSLFVTPLVLFDVPDAEALNADLRRVVHEREKSHPGVQASNAGGWQSSWDMDKWGGMPAVRLLAMTRNLANRITTDTDGRTGTGPHPGQSQTWNANMWANINRSGHGNEMHWHRGSVWSGVYYVDDGGISRNPELGGELEFFDPRGALPSMIAPHLGIAMPRGRTGGASDRIVPQAGRLVMFPSWLAHQVRPYRGNAERISIAINLTL
jgi:uncharacterized protein (TIGR02466 family)